MHQGFAKVPGGKVWYKIIGENKAIPLVVVHGGPGYPHDYLEPLADLANDREIIFYDQLGCGFSDKPANVNLWTVNRFVEELADLIKTLTLDRYHILGHSWGAALAVSFALTAPSGLKGLILTDPYLSTPMWMKDAKRLKKILPKRIQRILNKHEQTGTTDSDEYKHASQEFDKQFVLRLNPAPQAFSRSKEGKSDIVYNTMWGTTECSITGNLKHFDLSDKLRHLIIPVLLLCGRYDEATPESTMYFQTKIPHAQMRILENSAHNPFWNERGKFIRFVRKFLRQND